MKLYYSRNLNPRVAVAVARHLASPVKFVRASPRHPDHQAAFRPLNPNTLVPVLEEEPGRTLWETDAIACRLSQLAGSDFWRSGRDQPEMIRWVSWSAYHFTRAADPLYFWRLVVPQFSTDRPPPGLLEESLQNFRECARILDAELDGRRWLVGNTLSYADFRVASALPFADGAGLPLAEYRNVQRWHRQLLDIDAWRSPFEGLEG